MKNILEIRPYEDGDMEYVRQNPFQDEVLGYPELTAPANSYTCVFDGEIVATGGVKLLSEDEGEAWVIMTKQSKKSGIFGLIACRAIGDKLDSIAAELNLSQCQSHIRADFPKAIRFAEALGFNNPYEICDYFPGNVSALLYTKVYNERI